MTILPNLIYPVTIRTDKSAAISADHRLVTVTWKAKRDKTTGVLIDNKRPAVCVSIPRVSVSVTPTCLQTALQDAFEDMQKQIIVEHIETELDAGKAVTTVTINDNMLSFVAVAAWCNEQSTGKLSRKLLEDYFDNDVAAHILLAVARKFGSEAPDTLTAEQQQRAEKIIAQYRANVAALSNPNGKFTPEVAAQLQRAVELADESKLRSTLLAKLTAYQRPAETAILEDL
jgi:hypothetical protein